MATRGQTVIRIVCRVDMVRMAVDGQWVANYDPFINTFGYTLSVVPAPREALGFDDIEKAIDYYRQVCPNIPRREDGAPNRPLTAFSVVFEICP